ncbi:MAG: OB-fold domain-containing protein [Dehalococcoidia bacterium]
MAEYLGVEVSIAANDPDHLGYLQAAGEGRFVMQQCGECDKLRYPPGPACPLCQSLDWEWQTVSGRGTVYSYEVVVHPIHPAYRERAPYIVALVELDEQRGVPTEHDALRVITSLVDADGDSVSEEAVAIGLRVEVEFADLGDGLALPRFRLTDEDPEHEPWSFPGT